MRPTPTPSPLLPVGDLRWPPTRSSDAGRPDFPDEPLTPRDAAHLIGDPEVLRWARAHWGACDTDSVADPEDDPGDFIPRIEVGLAR